LILWDVDEKKERERKNALRGRKMPDIRRIRYLTGSQLITILVTSFFTTMIVYGIIQLPKGDITLTFIMIVIYSLLQSFITVVLVLFLFGRKPRPIEP